VIVFDDYEEVIGRARFTATLVIPPKLENFLPSAIVTGAALGAAPVVGHSAADEFRVAEYR
jgi:hypothetical protein